MVFVCEDQAYPGIKVGQALRAAGGSFADLTGVIAAQALALLVGGHATIRHATV